MEIQRELSKKLSEWKDRKGHKPLIIQGARQIGKTWLMQDFGQKNFEFTAYFNFESSEELCREFDKTKDPHRLLGILRLYSQCPIEAGRTLLIFDEIQQCNKALNSLKYFCEQAGEYHIIAAGSLLGVTLSQGDSFPVGKVEFLQMHPISFREFLHAEDTSMYEYIESISGISPLTEMMMGRIGESYRRYQICGGMPEASAAMIGNEGIAKVTEIQQAILNSYALDFAKHAPNKDIPRISAIWKSIPSQLSKENRKFLYALARSGARAREYEDALLWLEHAGLAYRVFCCNKPALPLSAYDDLTAFKIYVCDIGLLRAMSGLAPEVIWEENPLFVEFKGALAENAILQSLVRQYEVKPRYWASAGKAEVDFLLQRASMLIPIEVKSGTRLGGKSLNVYSGRYCPKIALRYSLNNLQSDGTLLNIPSFLADWTEKLVGMAINENGESARY